MPSSKWDDIYQEYVSTEAVACQCCRKCWIIVSGKRAGRCVHGGPYHGYLTLVEETENGTRGE